MKKRIQVSLNPVLVGWARAMMGSHGCDSLSEYLECLIRDEQKRSDRLGESPAGTSAFAARRTGTDSLNDAAAAPRSPFRAPRSPKPRKP